MTTFAHMALSLRAGRFAQWRTREATGKTCSQCGQFKPMDAYYKQWRGTGGRRAACIECHRIANSKRTRRIPHNPGRDRTPAGEGARA